MRSIQELSAEANSYDFSPYIAFSKWVHVCTALLRESRVYDTESEPSGDLSGIEHAYVLYLRFADLVLNKLCTHPEFTKNKRVWNQLSTMVPDAIKRSEQLKLDLLQRETPNEAEPEEEDFLTQELKKYENKSDIDVVSALQGLPRSSLTLTTKPFKIPLIPPVSVKAPQPPVPTKTTPTPLRTSNNEIKSIYTTEKGRPLRHIFVPKTLREQFLKFAEANTKRNLETCGMLCGKLSRNAFFVTDLVVPHQESTPDTCATTNEEELFVYVDERDLFLVGWIHTHPTQSCFMSSVDLHTHASYQLMLPESVAVVCSPSKQPSWGAFRLTDPPGIDVIRNCSQVGFHPHENSEQLYRSPDHYKEIDFEFTAVDLRQV